MLQTRAAVVVHADRTVPVITHGRHTRNAVSK